MNTLTKIIYVVVIIAILVSCGKSKQRPFIKEVDTEKNDNKYYPYIINGQPVYNLIEVPWQVGLLNPTKEIDCFCGGSIINKKWILTAAHCLYYEESGIKKRKTASEIYIFANSTNLNQGGEIYNVVRIIEHPEYNKITNDNDIALLELEIPISIYYENQIINLPTQTEFESIYRTGNNVLVSGWGATSINGDVYPEILMKATISFKSHSICQNNYRTTNNVVTNNMICAIGNNTDSCSGDSGGPLYTIINGKGIQLGITSWGSFPCANPNLYGVYTNVYNYKSWINDNCSNCLNENESIL